jgi:uncharacterized protein (DUF983 family)
VTDPKLCPECGSSDLAQTQGGGRRCARCGAALHYRFRWLPYILTIAAIGAALGIGSALAFQSAAVRQAVIWPPLALSIAILSRRFRELRKE